MVDKMFQDQRARNRRKSWENQSAIYAEYEITWPNYSKDVSFCAIKSLEIYPKQARKRQECRKNWILGFHVNILM